MIPGEVADPQIVTEDLVRYMAFAISESSGNRNFLVEDPIWAEDFAPNGKIRGFRSVYISLTGGK